MRPPAGRGPGAGAINHRRESRDTPREGGRVEAGPAAGIPLLDHRPVRVVWTTGRRLLHPQSTWQQGQSLRELTKTLMPEPMSAVRASLQPIEGCVVTC